VGRVLRIFGDQHRESSRQRHLKQHHQRANAVRLFNECKPVPLNQRDEAFKGVEKLRDDGPYTYQGYFACKWLA
jgi:hypothetical protein